MSSTLHSVPDVTTFAANVVVFLAAVAAAVAGAMHAVKKIKESWIEATKGETAIVSNAQVVGGLLQDAIGSALMAEQMRQTNTNLNELCNELRDVRILLERLIDRLDRPK